MLELLRLTVSAAGGDAKRERFEAEAETAVERHLLVMNSLLEVAY